MSKSSIANATKSASLIYVAAVIVWIGAIGAGFMAAKSFRTYLSDDAKQEAMSLVPQRTLDVTTQALAKADYEKIAARLQVLYPDVEFSARSGTGIVVSVDDIAKYDQWRLALAEVTSSHPDARWRFDQMCSGTECRRRRLRGLRGIYAANMIAESKKVNVK